LFLRKQFDLDYLPQAIAMFNHIQLYYQRKDNIKYVFTGFSSEGLYFNWPAIIFSATII